MNYADPAAVRIVLCVRMAGGRLNFLFTAERQWLLTKQKLRSKSARSRF